MTTFGVPEYVRNQCGSAQSTAFNPALEVAGRCRGAGGAVSRWRQNERVESHYFFSVFGARKKGDRQIIPVLRSSWQIMKEVATTNCHEVLLDRG